MPVMDNMVFTARQPQLNGIKIEATNPMDDVNAAAGYVLDYDDNVSVPFVSPSKLADFDLIDSDLMDVKTTYRRIDDFNEKPQSENESDDLYDECYSCFMCNISYDTQVDLNAHLDTHTDDDTFHHSNINSISEPLPQSSIKPSKYYRCNECVKMFKSQLSYHEHMLTHTGEKPHHCWVEDEKSERETALETSRQDIQNMLQKRKQQQLYNYNTELSDEYKKRVESLIDEKNSTGRIDMSQLTGPLFWKNALVKAGLREKDINPLQFQNQLRLLECTSCQKCFARLPQAQLAENKIAPSKPPCSSCFMIKNESALDKHKLQVHNESPPYVCRECLAESDAWFGYVQHMKMHLKYASKCSECVYRLMNKPENVIFLCHVCDESFDSDEKLRIHVQTHFENGQSNDDESFN